MANTSYYYYHRHYFTAYSSVSSTQCRFTRFKSIPAHTLRTSYSSFSNGMWSVNLRMVRHYGRYKAIQHISKQLRSLFIYADSRLLQTTRPLTGRSLASSASYADAEHRSRQLSALSPNGEGHTSASLEIGAQAKRQLRYFTVHAVNADNYDRRRRRHSAVTLVAHATTTTTQHAVGPPELNSGLKLKMETSKGQ